MTGKGPDMFLQRKGSRMAIRPDFWGNWQASYEVLFVREDCLRFDRDSYHYPEYHRQELARSYQNGLFRTSRGTQRYDPGSRTYKEWSVPHDWNCDRINDQGQPFYPRFTRDEARKIIQRLQHGRQVNPCSMGSGWTVDGPRVRRLPEDSEWCFVNVKQRFQQEHDGFWQHAHRIGENLREGFPALYSGINPNFRMSQGWPDELQEWIQDEPWYPRP